MTQENAKKTVYVSHAKDPEGNYRTELYKPLRENELSQKYNLILPHEHSEELFSSREFFRNKCDVIVVEATTPKLGVGIEAGWADAYDVPIIVLIKKDARLSNSLSVMARDVIHYENSPDMISSLQSSLERVLSEPY